MMNQQIKFFEYCFFYIFIFVILSGCGSKTISLKPEVTYGNPEFKNVSDLPQVKYKNQFNTPDTGNKAVEMTDVVYERLGDAMLARGEHFHAFLNYEKSLKKNKDNIRVEYKRGVALLAGDKSTEAGKAFQLVIQKQPGFALAYEGLGRVAFLKKEYDKGTLNFEKAIELDPLLWNSYNILGKIYDIQGKYDRAIKNYKTALTIKPQAGFIYNNLGVSLYLHGDYKSAVMAFHRALTLNHTSNRVYNNLGLALAEMELYDKALEAFKKGGSEAEAYNNLGYVYLKSGQRDKAKLSFTKAMEINPRFYETANENLKKCNTID